MSLITDVLNTGSDYELVQVVRILRHSKTLGRLSFEVSALPRANLSQVQEIERGPKEVTVRVAMDALTGVKSVLPDYFYQQLLTSLHDDSQALLDFLNIFNHRYYQLYIAHRERNHLLLRQEKEAFEGRDLTRFSQRSALNALSGLCKKDSALLPYSLLLGQKSNSLITLQQMLSDYFSLQVTVRATPYSYHLLPRNTLSQLSGRGASNNRLGSGMCLGKRCVMQAKSIEVTVAAASRDDYLNVSADSEFSSALKRFVRHYLRESTPIKTFLRVRRRFIAEPLLLSNSPLALRLGQSNCLAPNRKPDAFHKIILH
jgi:type VI secretion system protein ImpH